MAPGHRSPIRWAGDVIRAIKTPAGATGWEQAKRLAVRTAEPISGQSEDLGHPGQLTENEEEPNVTVSGTGPSGTQTHTSTNTDTGEADRYHPVAVEFGTTNVVDDLGEAQVTTAAEYDPRAALPTRPDIPKVSRDAESPIWLKSIERFQKEHPEGYKLMVGQLHEIQKLKDGHTWDTWLNRQGLDKASTETNHKWLRICKAYMPSLTTVRALATGLGNLDPHKVAPLVTTGVFVFVELCFGLMDPSTRDKAMGLLLKTNIVINKWVSREGDLRRIKLSNKSFMQSVNEKVDMNEKVDKIEEGLDALYFDSLVLMSSIYGAGRSRRAANFISRFPEWERSYQEIQNTDSAYGELKSQIESILKNNKENIEVLDWIGNRKEDPEPSHQRIKERTGVDDHSSTGGNWFLQTTAFTSWVDDIRHTTSRQGVFWLKGSMGTGKTTLLCRAISHFENSPVRGVKFVPYYCHGSGSGPGPRYEIILRALCRRLAWKSDGSVAEPAMLLYHQLKSAPDAQRTGRTTWEQLLRDLIASSSIKIVFVLDALDECEPLGDYIELLEFLTNLPPQQNGPFLLVSSQPHVPVWRYFDRLVHTFEIVQDETTNEMQTFIENQINSKKKVHWEESIFFKNPEKLEELKSALLVSAGGMFRWVEIWIGIFFPRNKNAVRREANAQKLLNELKNFTSLAALPHDESDTSRDDQKKMALTEAYGKLWHINGDYGEDKDLQTRLFQIITASFESLTPQAILEAVCFDSSKPPDHYEKLDSDHVAGLYSSFLKVNGDGCLEYEHLSAKAFVEEIRVSNIRPFSSHESHKTIAEIAICAIERPSHRLWIDSNIDLVGRGLSPRASFKGTGLTLPEEQEEYMSKLSLMDSHGFGSYLFEFWLQHCQIFSCDQHFIQQMSNLVQRANPAFEGWVLYVAEYWDWYHNTLTRVSGQKPHARRPIPFLCMVSFGFSPISHIADQPALLQGFEDRTVRNLDGQTALHVACDASNINIVEDLLKLEYASQGSYFALLSVKDHRGCIPLNLATDHDVIKLLLQYELREPRKSPASPTSNGSSRSQLLHFRDYNGFMAIEKILMRDEDLFAWIFQRSLVEPQAMSELFSSAIESMRSDSVKRLLENGANPNMKIDGRISVLSFALLCSRIDCAKQLFDHGARLKEGEELRSVFERAVMHFDVRVLDFLHSCGVSMDTDYKGPGLTALSWAVTSQNLDLIDFLLDRGANVHRTKGPAGVTCRTLLRRAVSKGNIMMAELLLDHGADVNASSANFSTPLASAVSHGNREMAEFLIDRGADATLLNTSDNEALDTIIQR